MGKTSAPGVPCFDRFKQEWDAVKVKPFHSGLIDDQVVRKIPVAMQVGIKEFCLDQLKEKHPRDDYKEMLQLILLFLGENLRITISDVQDPFPMLDGWQKPFTASRCFCFGELFTYLYVN